MPLHLITREMIGSKHAAMVVMGNGEEELCFLVDHDMSDEAFIQCCKALRLSFTLPRANDVSKV